MALSAVLQGQADPGCARPRGTPGQGGGVLRGLGPNKASPPANGQRQGPCFQADQPSLPPTLSDLPPTPAKAAQNSPLAQALGQTSSPWPVPPLGSTPHSRPAQVCLVCPACERWEVQHSHSRVPAALGPHHARVLIHVGGVLAVPPQGHHTCPSSCRGTCRSRPGCSQGLWDCPLLRSSPTPSPSSSSCTWAGRRRCSQNVGSSKEEQCHRHTPPGLLGTPGAPQAGLRHPMFPGPGQVSAP